MKNLEFNKIFSALLIAGILAMFSGFVADALMQTSNETEKDAVTIESAEGHTSAGVTQELKLPEPILSLILNADLERGQKTSKACTSCHNFTKDGVHSIGPQLWNIVGEHKQSKEGYSYSGKLNQQGGEIWTYDELNKFLEKPKKYANGTKMNFVGLKKASDRANIIAWLRTLSDDPISLPSEDDIQAENARLQPDAPIEDDILTEELTEDISEDLPVEELSTDAIETQTNSVEDLK